MAHDLVGILAQKGVALALWVSPPVTNVPSDELPACAILARQQLVRAFVVRLAGDVIPLEFLAGAIRDAAKVIRHGQRAARWANTRRATPLAPFLQQIVRRADTKIASAGIALDLEDELDVERLAGQLEKCNTIQSRGIPPRQMAAALATIKGAVLWVDVDTPPRARLQFEFNVDLSASLSYAKPLLLELLASYGAQIDELADWQVAMVPSAVRLDGKMSASMVRRVFNFLTVQPPVDDQEAVQSKLSQKEATLREFKIIVMLLGDLKLRWEKLP